MYSMFRPNLSASSRQGCVIWEGVHFSRSRPLTPLSPPRNSRKTSSTRTQNDTVSNISFMLVMLFVVTCRKWVVSLLLWWLFLVLQFPWVRQLAMVVLIGWLALMTTCVGRPVVLSLKCLPD